MNFWNSLPQEAVETNRISRFIKGRANSRAAAGQQTDAEGNRQEWSLWSCCYCLCGSWRNTTKAVPSPAGISCCWKIQKNNTGREEALMSPAEHCLSSHLQAKSDLPGGCRKTGQPAGRKIFAFLFNFHLCSENLINAHFLSSTTFPFSIGKTAGGGGGRIPKSLN